MALSPAAKRVQIARSTMLLDQPFFGVLALRLRLIEDDSCQTAWTDGVSLGYSPAFVATCTDDQLKGLIAHEVMHCACGHPWRRGARDQKRFNVAADYAINQILTDAGMALPDGGLLDPQYAGRWAEWIYDRLPKENDGQGGQPGHGKPDPAGEVRDAPADANGQDAPTEADWQAATKQAAKLSRGTLKGAAKESINEALRPRVDWRSLLRRYLQEVAKADYSWNRPNPRYIPSGLYLPSLHSIECGKLTIAVDTSGSIDTVLLGQFAAEISAIAAELQPRSIEVLYCDTHIHRVDTFDRGEQVVMHAVGRGGTSFIPVFDHVNNGEEMPACVVYLTDLDGSFPSEAPGYPVIWAAYGGNVSAPFGDVVPCE